MAIENHCAKWETGEVVKAVDGADVVLLENAGVEYFLRSGSCFFFGLEDEDGVAVGGETLLGDEAGELKEDGGVAVMAAAVSDGEGVDVAPDGDGGARGFSAPDRYDAESADVGIDFVGVALL